VVGIAQRAASRGAPRAACAATTTRGAREAIRDGLTPRERAAGRPARPRRRP
jgi:hypothetical protein